MDADEEQNFAALLSQSAAPATRPTWSPPSTSTNAVLDPWANPFASSPTNPFSSPPPPPSFTSPSNGNSGSDSGFLPPAAGGFDEYPNGGFSYDPSLIQRNGSTGLDPDVGTNSPYVQKLEREQIISSAPDPPSVIAARERESLPWGDEGGFGGETSYIPPSTLLQSQPAESPSKAHSWESNGFSEQAPTSPPKITPKTKNPKAGRRALPADLIDEDLMAASDPSISLKRAFVKSTPAPVVVGKTPEKQKQGAYVFRPPGKSSPVKHQATEGKKVANGPEKKAEASAAGMIHPAVGKEISEGNPESAAVEAANKEPEASGTGAGAQAKVGVESKKTGSKEGAEATQGSVEEPVVSSNTPAEPDKQRPVPNGAPPAAPAIVGTEPNLGSESVVPALQETSQTLSVSQDHSASNGNEAPTGQSGYDSPSTTTVPVTLVAPPAPTSIPLPESLAPTRTTTPLLPSNSSPSSPSPPFYPAQTPTHDRVAVSPLEPPTAQIQTDFGFTALSIGGSAVMPPPSADEGWDGAGSGSGVESGSRFGGKGWGAMDGEDDDGLFGKGGPARDPWGVGPSGGWGEDSTAIAGPSVRLLRGCLSFGLADKQSPLASTPSLVAESPVQRLAAETPSTPATGASVSPSKPRRKTHPVFTISISDPARVGDPVRGYTVYTIRTHTTSPHYRKSDFTALRRFSDFLWLFDSLIANNPGIIVPPVPDKHTFGRFQEQFIETRRHALERSLNKIASHPVLQLDPDLRLFLESDNFSAEIKNRRPDMMSEPTPKSAGLLGSWNTPKFVESDDWFVSRTAFLDGLENQLKSLSKSIEVASKTRLDMATAYTEMADAFQALAESDLGSAMCASLAQLGDLARKEKEGAEELAKGDVVNLLNMADEYVRFVGSCRRAMGGRVRVWLAWQALDKEVGRLKTAREKLRAQGKLGDRAAQTLAEINEVSQMFGARVCTELMIEIDRRARGTQQEYDTLTKLVKSEFGRFERERVDEFKRVLERYLEDQIDRQRSLIMAWEEYHAGVLGMVKKAQGIRDGAGRVGA